MVEWIAGAYIFYLLMKQGNKVSGIPYANEINFAANYYGISAKLIAAIIRVESNFDSFARGSAGEIGLMQIQVGAWQDSIRHNGLENFSYGLATNPKINILVGAGYLKYLRDTCSTNQDDIIRAFNAGCTGSKLGRSYDYLAKVKTFL